MHKSLTLIPLMISLLFLSNCGQENDFSITPQVNPIVVDEDTAVADDADSLIEAVQEIRSQQKTKLYLSAMILWDDSSCPIELVDLSDIIIFGSPNSVTGIRRTGGYSDSNVLKLRNCSNIRVQDITLDEGAGARYTEEYKATVWVNHSTDIEFQNTRVIGSKGVMSVGVSDTEKFSFIDSTIDDAGAFGLWVNESTGLLVQDSSFKDNRSNALFIDYVYGDEWGDNLVVGNDFDHNHCDAVFNACNGPCPGGQLDIIDADYLIIRENTIHDGKIDTYPDLPLYSSGIELNDGDHIRIEYNDIRDNTGNCIYKNSSHTLTNTTIEHNTFKAMNGHACTRNMEGVTLNDNRCE